MKKILLFVFLFPFLSKSQVLKTDSTTLKSTPRKANLAKYNTQTLYSYSIGLKAFSLEEFPKILNQTNSEGYRKQYLNGFILKLNDNQISYRITGSFFTDSVSFKNDCAECETAKGKMTDNSFRIGFEKNFIYADIQPYFGFDLGFRRNSFKGSSQNAGLINYTIPYDVKTQKNGLTVSPLFGIKWNAINHITLSIESSIDLLYSYEKQEKTYIDATRTRTFNDFKKWEFLLRPVGLFSLQYNFGESY